MAPSNASTKKLAKVAKSTKGTTLRERSDRTFPMAIIAIIVVGTLLVFYGRNQRVSAQGTPPKLTDHFHVAYGIYNCDTFVVPATDRHDDKVGIHTHDDGIIHIHPRSSAAAGERSTLSHFLDEVDIAIKSGKLTLADGTVLESGKSTCADGQVGTLAAAVWKNADDTTEAPTIVKSDIPGIRFANDRMAITIAFVPEDKVAEIPRPESIPQLDQLTDVVGASTTAPSATASTEIGATTSTLGGETTTTVAGATTTTSAVTATTAAGATATTAVVATTTR